jgi:hypothetical protein
MHTLCVWAALVWLPAVGCSRPTAVAPQTETAVLAENGGATAGALRDSLAAPELTPGELDTVPFVDPAASFQARRGSGVVFGGYANDAVGQAFTVSLGTALVGIDLYVTSYPPESPSREFRWLLRDATGLDPDAPDVPSLPVLTSGTAYSVQSKFPYDAPPCRIELPSPLPVRPDQVLLLETRPMTEESIVWNGGFGAVPGGTYWCQAGTWSKIRGSATRALGRAVWMTSR